MVGDTGLEPVTSAMSTLDFRHEGLTNVNLEKLYKSYLQDRINTKGLTKAILKDLNAIGKKSGRDDLPFPGQKLPPIEIEGYSRLPGNLQNRMFLNSVHMGKSWR